MALSQAEQDVLNESFMKLDWSDPHATLVAMGAGDGILRAILNRINQQERTRMESLRDHALAELARLNA